MLAQARKPQSLSAFGDQTACPTEAELRRVLGHAASPWDDLVRYINATYAPIAEQWHFGGAKYGWSLRLGKPGRVILYLIPQPRRFLVGIVLGAKAVAAAQTARLSARVLSSIAAAPHYAEGTGLRLLVSKASDLPSIEKLTALKMAAR